MITCVVTPAELSGDEVALEGDVYRHLFRARRLAVGAELRLVDGEGRARRARVVHVGPKRARAELHGALPANDPSPRLTLLVAPPRPERASWLVEKATELGVHAIHFVATERAPRDYGTGRLDRLRRVATSALEQSGGARLPRLDGVHPWDDVPTLLSSSPRRLVLVPGAPALSPAPSPGDVAVLVGPEGGLTDDELSQLREHDVEPAGLGGRTLRVETAALVAAGVLLASS